MQDISVFPYRLRENIVGISKEVTPLINIQWFFQKVYGLDLEEEQQGLEIPSLESCLKISGKGVNTHLSLRLKRRTDICADDPYRRVLRNVDTSIPNVRTDLKSLVAFFFCTRGCCWGCPSPPLTGYRTCDLLIDRQVLYYLSYERSLVFGSCLGEKMCILCHFY